MPNLKSLFFPVFKKFCRVTGGSGVGKMPGVMAVYDFLFWRLWLNRDVAEVNGSKMCVNPAMLPERYRKPFRDYIVLDWEKATVAIFQKVVKEGDVVLDLGANMGFFTLLAARLVGEPGRVYSFEPEPTNYSLLLKNIELNGYRNVTAIPKAVSRSSGMTKLYISDNDIGNNTIYEYGEGRRTMEVGTVALDDFFAGKDNHVDIIKMDIEGAEMAAFLGMEKLIAANQNLKIFCEFYPKLMNAMGYSPEGFVQKLLTDYHFSVRPIDYLPVGTTAPQAISSVEELMSLFEKVEVLNLFLERDRS